MSLPTCRLCALLVLVAPLAPHPGSAQETLDAIVTSQIGRGLTSGVVLGVWSEGGITSLQSWGSPSHVAHEPLTPDALFPFPGLTEVMLALTVRALDAAGNLDVGAPLGSYVADLPPRLTALTLQQLLTHTAGLDDFPPPDELDWSQVLDDLPAAALFTEPGLVYSHSRYSYPLAARALERITRLPLEEVLERALLGPLGMSRTTFALDTAQAWGLARGYGVGRPPGDPVVEVEPRERDGGLPVAFTTAPDVLTLLGAWMGGRIRGVHPSPDSTPGAGTVGTPAPPTFRDGLSADRYRGVERLSLTGNDQGFGLVVRVLPASGTAIVAWSNGFPPSAPEAFVENRLLDSLGGPPADASPTPTPATDEARAPLDWAGTYRNGEKIIVLEVDGDRLMLFDGVRDLPLVALAGGWWGIRTPDGRLGSLTFRLHEAGGRRFVLSGGLAYLRRR